MIVDIVTGATQGIGKAIAASIAQARASGSSSSDASSNNSCQDYLLVLVGRNVARGTRVAEDISKASNLTVVFEPCQMGQYAQIQELKNRIAATTADYSSSLPPQIGILVNNAAECPRQQCWYTLPRRQDDGSVRQEQVDAQFATNVLGYHFMMNTFHDWFAKSTAEEEQSSSLSSSSPSPSATKTYVVNVASNWAGDLNLQDVNFRQRSYDNDTAYRQSKQANRMLSAFWATQVLQSNNNVLVNACHPGDPRTTLSCALGYNTYANPPDEHMLQAASNPILNLAGLRHPVVHTTGGWFDGSTSPHRDRFASHHAQSQALYDLCESYCVLA